METVIDIKINNLIQNYSSNFLSYLYLKRGWNRVMLDLAKENYIESTISSRNIRLVVTSTGEIFLTCYCIFDFLKAMTFLEEEFAYGRMKNYLEDDSKVSISTSYETRIPLKIGYQNKTEFTTPYGTIQFDENGGILKYSDYHDGEKLVNFFRDMYFPINSEISKEINIKKKVEKKKEEEDSFFELMLLSSLAIWASSKIGQLFI